MRHSQEDYGLLATRQGLFDDRLDNIRAYLHGDLQSVLELVADEQGRYSEETTRQLADELTSNVDDLQKAWWIQSDDHDEQTERAKAASPAWQELAASLSGWEDEVSFDLAQAPTTLTEEQRATVRALFYCLLRASTCDVLCVGTVGELRRLLGVAAELCGRPDDEDHPRRMTHAGLLFRELGEERFVAGGYSPERWEVPFGETPFGILDKLWSALHDESVTTLDDPDLVRRFEGSDAWRKEAQAEQWAQEQMAEQPGLRRIAGVAPKAWRTMGTLARWQAVRGALDDPSEEALLALPDDQIFFLGEFFGSLLEVLGFGFGAEFGEAWWKGLPHERRAQIMRDVAEREIAHLAEPFDPLDLIDGQYRDQVVSFDEMIRRWAERTGGIDELFEQYRLLRRGFFGQGLPVGAPDGASRDLGRWYPEGFSKLASTALEMALAERDLSCLQDDYAYHQTYAALGEVRYDLESVVRLIGERRARGSRDTFGDGGDLL